MSNDLPSHDDDPDAIEGRLDSIVQSILTGPCDERAKEIIADAHRRALARRKLNSIEAREQAFLIVAAGLKAAEQFLDPHRQGRIDIAATGTTLASIVIPVRTSKGSQHDGRQDNQVR